jgi:hypothetical protein
MSERTGFFDEFERPTRIDARYRAEHVACRVLGGRLRCEPKPRGSDVVRGRAAQGPGASTKQPTAEHGGCLAASFGTRGAGLLVG